MDQTLRSNRKRLRTEVVQGNSYDEIASMNDHPIVATSNGYNNNCNAFTTYCCHGPRRFLPIPVSHHVFHSEDWKPKGETMFIPTQTDALINLQNIEQITVTKGTFFLCDENSRFKRSAEGISFMLFLVILHRVESFYFWLGGNLLLCAWFRVGFRFISTQIFTIFTVELHKYFKDIDK